MTFIRSFLQRFGLFAPAKDTTEVFGLRLDRLETREGRRVARSSAFAKGAVKSLA